MDANKGGQAAAPVPLDNLSKEDLLVKCRNLIVISKKAKAAKDGDSFFIYLTNHLFN